MSVLSMCIGFAVPWRAYFSQRLFARGLPVVWNPYRFARMYRIQYLNRCWRGDCVRLLERCWERMYDRHEEQLSADG
ncbi:MAG: hypothetical protein AAFY57_15045 [Cyanobacteria bacterium J06642_2]